MSRTTQRREFLHNIRELAEAGLLGDGDGQIQAVSILAELAKYVETLPYDRPDGTVVEAGSPSDVARFFRALARRWYERIERPRGREEKT